MSTQIGFDAICAVYKPGDFALSHAHASFDHQMRD
jgi:hypothetical protein